MSEPKLGERGARGVESKEYSAVEAALLVFISRHSAKLSADAVSFFCARCRYLLI